MIDSAIIFDVDGVLLELTHAEEELFFQPFAKHCDATKLSRDWNSYRVRNDEDIVAELVERLGLASQEKHNIRNEYLALLDKKLNAKALAAAPIAGAQQILQALTGRAALGIATANYFRAAQLRLQHVGLWNAVSAHAFGADGGGHKRAILARALTTIPYPKSRIVFVGDNVSDVEAGHGNGVHFIGFSLNPERRKTLAAAGAIHISADHQQTRQIIASLLWA